MLFHEMKYSNVDNNFYITIMLFDEMKYSNMVAAVNNGGEADNDDKGVRARGRGGTK